LWDKFAGKVPQKLFGQVWAKILRTLKNLPAPTPMIYATVSYVCF